MASPNLITLSSFLCFLLSFYRKIAYIKLFGTVFYMTSSSNNCHVVILFTAKIKSTNQIWLMRQVLIKFNPKGIM